MKLITLFLVSIFFLVFVNARHLHETDSEEQENVEDSLREQSPSRSRHRRRSRQPYLDYNYPPYYDYRREHTRQDETYSEILKLIDEMSTLVKHTPPPPPPQPIYIPYPVPYPVLSFGPCKSKNPAGNSTGANIPDFTDRWPQMEDILQNWGLQPGDVGADDSDDDDGSRPISLDPIMPSKPVKESPPVEHGSVQAGMETTTIASPKKPGICQVAILNCCSSSSRRDRQVCFDKYGCRKTFSTGLSCRPDVVKAVLDEFAKVYAPSNEP